MKIEFKNYLLKPLVTFLYDLELTGLDSRMRTRFIILLSKYIEENEQLLKEIAENYAELNEDGTFKMEEVNDQYVPIYKDKQKFTEEYTELNNEKQIILITEENEKIINSVANSVFNYDGKLSKEDAVIYNEFCNIFEELEEGE